MLGTLYHLLRSAGADFVRVLWCDHASLIRAKASYLKSPEDLAAGVSIAAAQQALPVMADSVVSGSGLGPVGDVRLVPDLTTLRLVPYVPGHAQVIGDMHDGEGPWEQCPRDYLRQQVGALSRSGVDVRVAFESEFYLLRSIEPLVAGDSSVFAMTSSMNAQSDVVQAVAAALTAQGIEVEHYYPESGPGQHELSVGHAPALQAADNHVTYRETVRGVAQAHGLFACFLPVVFEHAAGSGCHLNLSLWRNGSNITAEDSGVSGLSSEAEAFIAGVLDHLPALMAITTPTPNSFRRIRPQQWAGAYRSWGTANREASVRVTRGLQSPVATRFEIKTVDNTANPYLALGAVLAAGRDGLKRNLKVPSEATSDPATLTEEQRRRYGMDLLPTDLGGALDALRNDDTILGSLNEARARSYLAVKDAELAAFGSSSLLDEVRMLAERY